MFGNATEGYIARIRFNRFYTEEDFIRDRLCFEFKCSYKDIDNWSELEYLNKIHYLNLIDNQKNILNKMSYGS